jgi:hypothetical protein
VLRAASLSELTGMGVEEIAITPGGPVLLGVTASPPPCSRCTPFRLAYCCHSIPESSRVQAAAQLSLRAGEPHSTSLLLQKCRS